MAINEPYESLFAGTPTAANKRGPGRPKGPSLAGIKPITKSQILDVLNMANVGIALSPYGRYQLTRTEIEALADAWHDVIKDNPYIGKYLVVGKKLGTWGALAFVHYQIIAARIPATNPQVKKPTLVPTPPARPADPKPNGIAAQPEHKDVLL